MKVALLTTTLRAGASVTGLAAMKAAGLNVVSVTRVDPPRKP